MKKMVLKQISARGGNAYELLFGADGGATILVNCTADESDGIRGINVSPDIFMTHGVLARPIAAAVWAFHRARLSADEAESEE